MKFFLLRALFSVIGGVIISIFISFFLEKDLVIVFAGLWTTIAFFGTGKN